MSDHETDRYGVSELWRAKAVVEGIMDTYSAAIDTHEGVRLMLALAYAEGVRNAADHTIDALRAQLAAL